MLISSAKFISLNNIYLQIAIKFLSLQIFLSHFFKETDHISVFWDIMGIEMEVSEHKNLNPKLEIILH